MNPSTGTAETGGSLSLKPAQSRDLGSGQPNREGEKAGDDVIERGGHVPVPVSIMVCPLQPCDSGCRVRIEKTGYGIVYRKPPMPGRCHR